MEQGNPLIVERSNYRFEFAQILAPVMEEIEAVLLSGDYILSQHVSRFERAFADFIGCDHALGVNSGTDALVLALEALDIGSGDEVITVANTFHATALAIARTGAKTVLVDARINDFLMDVSQIEAAITPRTKAILPVHLFGLALDLTSIVELCQRHNLYLIEDCAQAAGAKVGGKRVGSIGNIGCFSFHPSKNLAAAGDAGMVTTSDAAIAHRVRGLRYFGQRERKVHSEFGYNSKTDAVQAIVLAHKLPFLDEWNELRHRQAERYRSELSDLQIAFQSSNFDEHHVYHLFQVQTSEREALRTYLVSRGIDAVVRYPCPIHLQPPFADLGYQRGEFPVAEHLADTTLCLPIRPDMNSKETEYVVGSVREFFADA